MPFFIVFTRAIKPIYFKKLINDKNEFFKVQLFLCKFLINSGRVKDAEK